MHENQLHAHSSFVTLTYDEEHYGPSLDYRDFQLFMKRLRKAKGPTRFFACGEYGEQLARPHFHACLFGHEPFSRPQKVGKDLYTSRELEKLWGKGHVSFGTVTMASAGYIARYCVKKKTGPQAETYYKRIYKGEMIDVAPEFAHMSLRPAIGRPWFDRYWSDVYQARDGVVVGRKTFAAPRYYDRLLDGLINACSFGGIFPITLAIEKEVDRYTKSLDYKDDVTPERLAVRESIAVANINRMKRTL